MMTSQDEGLSVALVIHRRPEHTRRVFAAIRQARPDLLFVLADGPRPGVIGEVEAVRAARAVTEEVDWPCTVVRDYSEEPLGCRRRILTGLNLVFTQVSQAIILEDDCVPDASFFPYASELLNRYRDDPQVMSIGGNLWEFPDGFTEESYWFSAYPAVWGWATWARAWWLNAQAIARWPDLRSSEWLEQRWGGRCRASQFWRRSLDAEAQGSDNWDYTWALAHWLHDGVAIRPSVNLVENVGFDESATHTRDPDSMASTRKAVGMAFPLTHPATTQLDPDRDELVEWIDHSGVLERRMAVARARLRDRSAGRPVMDGPPPG